MMPIILSRQQEQSRVNKRRGDSYRPGCIGETMGYTAKRVQVQEAKPKPAATQKALKAGPAGKQTNADGSKHSSPNPHGPTDVGNGKKGNFVLNN
jgi:hypothetical protein